MSNLTKSEKLERMNNGSLIDATFEECNRMAMEYGLTVHTLKKVRKTRYCLMFQGKEQLCTENLLDMHKFCSNPNDLAILAETVGAKPEKEPYEFKTTADKFWNVLVVQMLALKRLPSDIQVDIEGSAELYANIEKSDIIIGSNTVLVRLDKRHTLTLFEREDYTDDTFAGIVASTQAVVLKEMASLIRVSKRLDLSNLLLG